MKLEKRNIDLVKPYWRNPRNNEKSIELVKESIRQYGYNQPIVVDKDDIIVAGHTRYKALRQLGYEEVTVVVLDLPEDKAKQYRIADNKASEQSTWNDDLLMFELREIEELQDMSIFFQEGELEELLDLDIDDFISDNKEEEKETIRAEIIATIPDYDESKDDEIDETVNAIYDSKVKQAEEEAKAEEQRKFKELEDKMNGRFKDQSEEKQDNYIQVECPHCAKQYALSREELLRNDARQRKERA